MGCCFDNYSPRGNLHKWLQQMIVIARGRLKIGMIALTIIPPVAISTDAYDYFNCVVAKVDGDITVSP
ncbi:MAG: hypothetical protein WBA93_32425 [Microcoleaceae cyanobacterium]